MPDTDPSPRVHASDCGRVTVRTADGPRQEVRLTVEAVRMPGRELAELITQTAREAADALAAEDPAPGSAADALAELKDLRDGLREQGLNAVIERKRAQYGADVDLPAEDPRVQSRSALSGEYPVANLDMAIAVLERFQGPAGAAAAGNGLDGITGTATSPEGDVTVETTGAYPIARLLLGIHARDLGPDVLAAEIDATAERARAELQERQRAGIDALGLPLTMEQVDGLPEEAQAFRRKSLGQAAFLLQDHEQQIRRLRQ